MFAQRSIIRAYHRVKTLTTQLTSKGPAPLEERWLPARLIPTSGIKGVDEQERRATSAMLSVMMAVPEFSRSLLKKLGAPAGAIKTFIEPPLETPKGKSRPDGAVIITRGSTSWRAFVEVKTGTNELQREQIEGYLDLARDNGFHAMITISNQLATATDKHPLDIDKRKMRKVGLYHFSWVEILSEAILQREFRGVSDPDQAWILGELIAYLQHPSSGAMEFQDMGKHWVQVRDSARDGTLRVADAGVDDVVVRWDQFMQYICLYLMRELGVKVTQVVPRAEQNDPLLRKAALVRRLVEGGSLDGTIRVPNAAGDMSLATSLRVGTVTASLSLAAPDDGRPATRINWLVKQLSNAPGDARIDATFAGVRGGTSSKLAELREDSRVLLATDRNRPPRTFTVALTTSMGTKRGGTEGFIGQATKLTLEFYSNIVQSLKPWRASPAKLPSKEALVDIATQPESLVEQVAQREIGEEQAPLAATDHSTNDR
jgi:hypothetical protein